MSIRILRPGLLMTVQDLGRHGHQHVAISDIPAVLEIGLEQQFDDPILCVGAGCPADQPM